MISIIIPTFNEADQIAGTINGINAARQGLAAEIIVADGGSTDSTILIAEGCGATTIRCSQKGRAAQMNQGAAAATGQVLYFLHADSIPPENFLRKILAALTSGAGSGCFRLQFDLDHWFLKANCWFTQFDLNAVRFGDQSLFVVRDVFEKSGGFREDLIMMEDQEIVNRLKRHGPFKVLDSAVTTSARKYRENGVFRMQTIFYRIWLLYYLGFSQDYLLQLHRRLIRSHKL